MTVPRARHHHLAFALLAWLAPALGATGQETLARAKDLYATAAYDEALAVLSRLHENASPPESSEIAGYQVFCLLALGRTDEAQKAITALVRADPLYRPSESTASPRTRAAFDAVRRGLLPTIVQEIYDKAKAAFDRKEAQVALTEFDRVLALLDDPGLTDFQNLSDLRRIATGFRDLSSAAVASAASSAVKADAPEPRTTAPPPAPVAPATEAPIYGVDDAGVVPPATISRSMPVWQPRNEFEKRRQFRGVLEVVVDEMGNVTSVVLGKSVHPIFDSQLVERARSWKFRPAMKDGVPVRYKTMIEVRLGPGGGSL